MSFGKSTIVKMCEKIKNIFWFLFFCIFDFFAIKRHTNYKSNELMIIRFDAIGDYILFRNFLPFLKRSKKYKNYRLTLCGNKLWRDIANSFDKKFVDDFFWVERNRFIRDLKYRFNILREISKNGYEVVIQPAYSRDYLFADSLVKASNAKHKIGSEGKKKKNKIVRYIIYERYYTYLIKASKNNMFEFYRNKEFFENLLETKIDLEHTDLDVKKIKIHDSLPDNYVILFPGAGEKFRRWNVKNFADIADYIWEKYKLTILIGGSKEDQHLSAEIMKNTKTAQIDDIAGKYSLSEFCKIVSKADLLIGNETSAVHIAAAVKTKTICISSGYHIHVFNPYPKQICNNIVYLYPFEYNQDWDGYHKISLKFNHQYLNINNISTEMVKKHIDKLLSE